MCVCVYCISGVYPVWIVSDCLWKCRANVNSEFTHFCHLVLRRLILFLPDVHNAIECLQFLNNLHSFHFIDVQLMQREMHNESSVDALMSQRHRIIWTYDTQCQTELAGNIITLVYLV